MKLLLLPILLVLSTASRASAEDPAAILARVDAFRNPFASFSVDVELSSFNGAKRETSRVRVFAKGSDRTMIEFVHPQSDKGKSLLMLRDAMWIYLPSASRPIRISPLQRLMGQASNGDVARTSFAVDYDPTAVTSEDLGTTATWVLDLAAKDPAVSYRKVRLWVDRSTAAPIRADFYVATGKLIKRAHYREVGDLAGRRSVTKIEIEDLVRPGQRTVMSYSNLVARENPERMFMKESFGK